MGEEHRAPRVAQELLVLVLDRNAPEEAPDDDGGDREEIHADARQPV
jgi:hypothetical protein